MKKITILLPAYNEASSIPLLQEKMAEVAQENPGYEWEFLIVNDGSTDDTLQRIKALHNSDPRFSYIDLSRNYGKEIAMMAGFDYASGDAVIIMDSDMQHPVSSIPEMLRLWEEGWQDVYAQRKSSKESWFKRKSSELYYRLLQNTTRIPIQKNTGDFRLLDRVCINALREMRETQRNTKGMYCWIGFRKKGITYEQLERVNGTTKWRFWSLMNLALDGLTAYTTSPLRIASILGIICSIIGFVYLVYILVNTLLYGDPVAGYPTIMVTILFIGGVQLLSLGIIGEYLGRVFNESKRRPPYFVNTYNNRQIGSEPASFPPHHITGNDNDPRFFKQVINKAIRAGLIFVDPFNGYKISTERVDRGFLTEDELEKMMSKNFASARLNQVRDIFIFACFTGLAYIDLAHLRVDNIQKMFDGRWWIVTHRQKTNTKVMVPLLPPAMKILKKYEGEFTDGKLLPIITNQKLNCYLKEIADICGINKNITFHLARHTFATTMTLGKGVPIESVSKMLGHTNIQTTQIYARITNDKISKDMEILSHNLGVLDFN